MMNYFTEVCVESSNCFILKPPGAISKPAPKPPKPQPPRGFALRLKRTGGPIEIRGAGGERATGTCLCVIALLGLPCFLLASGRRRKKTGKQTAQKKEKKKESILY
jgi:hypothetical protein